MSSHGHPTGYKRGCAECAAHKRAQREAKAARDAAAKRRERAKARRVQRDTAPFRERYQKVADVVEISTGANTKRSSHIKTEKRSAPTGLGRNVEAFERMCSLHPSVCDEKPAEVEACRTMASQMDNELLTTHLSQIAKVYAQMLTDLFAGKKTKSKGKLASVRALSAVGRSKPLAANDK
jgi:hypothetical protein